jgi:hypothetical protein
MEKKKLNTEVIEERAQRALRRETSIFWTAAAMQLES